MFFFPNYFTRRFSAVDDLARSDAFTISPDHNPKIRALREQNDRLPVGLCPPEILAEIFFHTSPSFVVTLSHVCHYWREVATTCQDLWSTVDFALPRQVPAMIERSGGRSLTFFAVVRNSCIANALRNALEKTPLARVRELRVSLRVDEYNAIFSTPRSFSHLDTLEVRVSRSNMGRSDEVPAVDNNSSFLALRYLELDGCSFTWASPQFTSLNRLCLHRLAPQERPSISTFVSSLRGMINLQELILDDSFPLIPGSPITERADLPNLSELFIRGNFENCAIVLHLINPSPAARIQIDVNDAAWDNPQAPLDQFSHGLSTHFYGISTSHPIRKLVISNLEVNIPAIELRIRLQAYHNLHIGAKPLLDIVIGPMVCRTDIIMSAIVASVSVGLPLKNIDEVHVHDLDIIDESSWAKAAQSFCNARVLFSRGRPPTSLFWALLENVKLSSDISSILLPNLGRLHLQKANSSACHVTPDDFVIGQRCLDVLRVCLLERQKFGVVLEEFEIDSCRSHTQKEMEELRNIVGTLLWDGKGISSYEPCILQPALHRDRYVIHYRQLQRRELL